MNITRRRSRLQDEGLLVASFILIGLLIAAPLLGWIG